MAVGQYRSGVQTAARGGSRVFGRMLGLVVLVFVGWASVAPGSMAQELNCRVQLDYSQVSGTDTSALDELEDRIETYLNTRSWTPHRVVNSERIGCSMQVIIQDEPASGEYEARLVVSARRPIYDTAQSTLVLRLNDPEWSFSYSRGESLEHNLNRYDPLTSVLDFYAFLILGMDFDTFGERGGTAYLEQSRAISERARSDPSSTGWESFGSNRNRADFIDDLLDNQHRELRNLVFQYHYRVLDRFVDDPEAARQEAMDVLSSLETLEERIGRTYVIDHFFSSKFEELAALFRGSDVRQQARRTLTQLDPSHASTYNNALE